VRQIIIPLVLSSFLPTIALAQARGGSAPIKPCSLLTRELVEKVTPGNKQRLDAGPKEQSLGASGSACDWGDIMLQVDPLTPAQFAAIAKPGGKDWETIQGVGDAAYLHNIRDITTELFVRVGARTLGMLVTVPVGKTTAAIKPDMIHIANAIVPKLR
jgi:hypothetical protein